MNIPEIGTVEGLHILNSTADQRYLLGDKLFLRTHYPIQFRKYLPDNSYRELNEKDLLKSIIDVREINLGNSIRVLYGAPGSGKSELMRWMQTKIEGNDILHNSIVVRIARHEINALKILEKFQPYLNENIISDHTVQRWNEAQKKPRTISKLILLWTLERLLISDSEINALFYRLLNNIQPHIEKLLESQSDLSSLHTRFDIISKETWQKIIDETAIDINFEFEQFRFELTRTFSEHLMEGINLPDLLNQISKKTLEQKQNRPILLIDDLVQSVNVFATDILDYFLSLESGNWDVIIGLTPAAFETSIRGREILQRINYLDTIDDRVEKYWLSDELGVESFFIDEDNCHLFAAKYLHELQKINNWRSKSYFPFNQELLLRIYRGIPSGKGKSRFFLRHLKQIFQSINDGTKFLEAIELHAKKEFVALTDDSELASIAELFGPIVEDEDIHKISFQKSVVQQFQLDVSQKNIQIEPLIRINIEREAISKILDDDVKICIRDWLYYRPVNRQLLKELRKGINKWLRMVGSFNNLHREFIAKPNLVLRWNKTYLGIRPPVYFEDVDQPEFGIEISRSIGILAFDLYRYAGVFGQESKKLQSSLSKESDLVHLSFEIADLREKLISIIEGQLGLSLENLSFCLYIFLFLSSDIDLSFPSSINGFVNELIDFRNGRNKWFSSLNQDQSKGIQKLFDDYFKLRENIYDGPGIMKIVSNHSIEDLLGYILEIDVEKINRDFQIGETKLHEIIELVQSDLHAWLHKRNEYLETKDWIRELVDAIIKPGANGISILDIERNNWQKIPDLDPDLLSSLYLVYKLEKQ